jgi:hypothetical protein
MTGNKAYRANSQLLSRSTKLKSFRTLIRPVVTCAAETWALNISDDNALLIFERKTIKKIYGLVCENDV